MKITIIKKMILKNKRKLIIKINKRMIPILMNKDSML